MWINKYLDIKKTHFSENYKNNNKIDKFEWFHRVEQEMYDPTYT